MLSNRLWDYNYLKAANTHYLAAFFLFNCLTVKSKTVKAKKNHDCDTCTRGIKPGEKYILEKYRQPIFDSFDPQTGSTEKQIGIVYCTYKTCMICFKSQAIECFDHCFVDEIDMDDHGKPTGREFCQNCGMQKPILI